MTNTGTNDASGWTTAKMAALARADAAKPRSHQPGSSSSSRLADPVVAAAAQKLGRDAVLIDSPGDSANGTFVARWVLLANRDVLPGFPDIQKARRPLTATGREKLWTDSYSSLFAVLK